MGPDEYLRRILDALEGIHSGMEELRILKEHELGVRLEYGEHGPYVPSEAEPADEE